MENQEEESFDHLLDDATELQDNHMQQPQSPLQSTMEQIRKIFANFLPTIQQNKLAMWWSNIFSYASFLAKIATKYHSINTNLSAVHRKAQR